MLILGIMKFISTQTYKHDDDICVNLSESNIFCVLFELSWTKHPY